VEGSKNFTAAFFVQQTIQSHGVSICFE
jgi:hypothetical protein